MPKIISNNQARAKVGLREIVFSKLLFQLCIVFLSASAVQYFVGALSFVLPLSLVSFLVSSIKMRSIVSGLNSKTQIKSFLDLKNKMNTLSCVFASSIGVMLGSYLCGISYITIVMSFGLFGAASLLIFSIAKNPSMNVSTSFIYKGSLALIGMLLLSIFIRMQFLELMICILGVCVAIGMAALELKRLNHMSAYLDSNRLDNANVSGATDAVATYIASNILLTFYNLFVYILRFISIMNDERRR